MRKPKEFDIDKLKEEGNTIEDLVNLGFGCKRTIKTRIFKDKILEYTDLNKNKVTFKVCPIFSKKQVLDFIERKVPKACR